MAGNERSNSGGLRHASKKTYRRGNFELLPKAKGWSVANGKLHKEFACKDFRRGIRQHGGEWRWSPKR